jgi:hypothetical protein
MRGWRLVLAEHDPGAGADARGALRRVLLGLDLPGSRAQPSGPSRGDARCAFVVQAR